MKQPIQPLVIAKDGVLRFQENAIVRHLLDKGGLDLNYLARQEFSDADRMQFAMLIGYSLSGAGSLSYFDNETYEAAEAMHAAGISDAEARNQVMIKQLAGLRDALREPVAALYEIHPDDLGSAA